MKKTTIFTVLAFIIAIGNLLAQDPFTDSMNKFDLNRSITLNQTSQKKEIPLDIVSNTELIRFEIDCELYYNELSIEIMDPNGNSIGNFTVENMRKYKKGQKAISGQDEYNEIVTGQIYKVVRSIEGKWKIVVKPKMEVSAKINIRITQTIKH